MFRSGSLRLLFARLLFAFVCALAAGACGDAGPMAPSPSGESSATSTVSSDASLFTLITEAQPFRTYVPFPDLDTSPNGVLNASSAHQPLIRVGLNQVAAAALQNGRLSSGSFPDGSVIVKEVLGTNGVVNLYVVMFKDRSNRLAANGWLWAELRPTGGAEYSVQNRGAACTACHALDRGPQNDFVRTFERQR